MSGSASTALQETGATAVEYALMLSLIFLVIMGGVALVGTSLAAFFTNAATLL